MAELTPREEALVMPIIAEIAKEPGVPARDLGVLLHRKMSTVLRVTQRLVDAGVLERRQMLRVRSDRRERGYSGLFLADRPRPQVQELDSEPPETLRTSEKPVALQAYGPQRVALGELGERLRWGRLPLTQGETRGGAFTPGRAIQAGEEAWRAAIEGLTDEDVDVALSAGRRLLVLLGSS